MYPKKKIYIYIYIRDNIVILVMYCGVVMRCAREAVMVSRYRPIPHIVLGLYLTVTCGLFSSCMQLSDEQSLVTKLVVILNYNLT